MNVMHMKYAVEVAKAGSLSKASETLLIAQPNLSRSIKELEADLGISIFARTSKGMTLTPDGEEFIRYASDILERLDDIEMMYKAGIPARLSDTDKAEMLLGYLASSGKSGTDEPESTESSDSSTSS